MTPANEYCFGPAELVRDGRRASTGRRATGVALFDMTSFAKFLVKGRDAEAVLQCLCANDVAVPVGRDRLQRLLNERGGFESRPHADARSPPIEYLIVTGTAQATRDFS